ncbi:hypothetical protein A2U01_0081567, partial [Trifolium medium]|nr:hypothetical protein [Trifolium medium]
EARCQVQRHYGEDGDVEVPIICVKCRMGEAV